MKKQKLNEMANRQFLTAKENGQKFDSYDYNNCEGNSYIINKAYFYATEVLGAPDEIKIDCGDDGMNIIRITAVKVDNTGYDFSESEIEEVLRYKEEGGGFENEQEDEK